MRIPATLDFSAEQLASEPDFAVHLERFIDQTDTRAWLQVAPEVEDSGKGRHRLGGDCIRHTGLIGGRVERRPDGERTELHQTPRHRLFGV